MPARSSLSSGDSSPVGADAAEITGWRIRPDPRDLGVSQRWFDRPWPPDETRPASVPSSWQHDIGFDADQPSGVAWYRARIRFPNLDLDLDLDLDPDAVLATRIAHRWWLCFDSVATDCSAWAGASPIGRHVGDYVPFAFELPPPRASDARPAGCTEAELTLRVDRINAPRPEKTGDLQRGHITKGFKDVISQAHAGVWGEVRVRRTGPFAFEPDGVGVVARCLRPDHGPVAVNVSVRFQPPHAGLSPELRGGFVLIARITNAPDERSAAPLAEAHVALAPGQREADLTLMLPDARRWSPEFPHLYEAVIEVCSAPTAENGGAQARNVTERAISDRVFIPFGVRHVHAGALPTTAADAADAAPDDPGVRLFLNGSPIYLSGILEWGHEPAHIAPSPTRAEVRQRFLRLKELGFNCVCLCMVYPPRWFYEEADRLGILLWQEHPIWQSRMDDADLPEYQRLYSAFFRRDRNHPSVVLVSAACEHPSFHPDLAAWWWEAAGRELPGAARQVQTASFAWADLARTDLCDEHTYEHSNRWDEYLRDVRAHIADLARLHGPRPFVMGETVLYTSWPNVAALRSRTAPFGVRVPVRAGEGEPIAQRHSGLSPAGCDAAGDRPPWWFPKGFEHYIAFEDDVRRAFGDDAAARMRRQGDRFHLLGRKFQVERFRRFPGNVGLVMNHIRDVPQARCGFIADDGAWRFTPDQTRGWLGPCALILDTPDRCWAFFEDEFDAGIPCAIAASNFAHAPAADARLSVDGTDIPVDLSCPIGTVRESHFVVRSPRRTDETVSSRLPSSHGVRSIEVEATIVLTPAAAAAAAPRSRSSPVVASGAHDPVSPVRLPDAADDRPRNSWRLWAFDRECVRRELEPPHAAGVARLITPPFTDAESAWDDAERGYSRGFGLPVLSAVNRSPDPANLCPALPAIAWDALDRLSESVRVLITNRLSRACLSFIRRGGSVILLAGKHAGSVPTRYEWLFGQTPLIVEEPVLRPGDSEWITDLLQVDLVRRHCRIIDVDELDIGASIEPIIRLVYTHDQARPRAFDLCFHTRLDRGTLIVSTLDHSTAAGMFMLARLVAFARRAEPDRRGNPPHRALDPRAAESWTVEVPARPSAR